MTLTTREDDIAFPGKADGKFDGFAPIWNPPICLPFTPALRPCTCRHFFKDSIQDVQKDFRWREAYEASTTLCETCKQCEYMDACGGGQLAQRWSNERKFDNPSVYCESWKAILDHVWARISPTLVVDLEAAEAAAAP